MTDSKFSWKSFPSVTAVLALVNLGVYGAQMFAGLPWSPTPDQQLAWGGNFAVLTLTGDYWRLASNIFLHSGVMHLLFNMALLLMVGPRAEREFGKASMLAIYLIGGVLASFTSAWWLGRQTTQMVVSTGASGAIMAVCGALLLTFVLAEMLGKGSMHEPGFGKELAKVVGINVVLGMVVKGTDQAAHFGGLVAGILLASGLESLRSTGSPLRRFGLALMPALLVAAVCLSMLDTAGLPHLQHVRSAIDQEAAYVREAADSDAAELRQAAESDKAELARKLRAEQEEKQLPAPVSAELASGRSIKFGDSGSWFALSGDEKKAYAVDHERNQIAVIDLISGAVEKKITVPASAKSQYGINYCHSYRCDSADTLEIVVLKDKPLALVTSMRKDAVTFIDLATGTVAKNVAVGKYPRAIVLSPDERRAYVQNAGENTISIIDVESKTAVGKLQAGPDGPKQSDGRRMSMWFSADGHRLYTSIFEGWYVVGFDLATATELPATSDGFQSKLESVVGLPGSNDSVLAINRGLIRMLDTAGTKTTKRWEFCRGDETYSYDFNHALTPHGSDAHLIAVGHDGMPDFSEIQVANLESGASIGRFPAGHFIRKMQFSADGHRLFTVSSQGVFSILDLSQRLLDQPGQTLLCDFPVVLK